MLNLKSSNIPHGLGPFCRLVCPPMGPELVLEDELGTFRAHIHTRTPSKTGPIPGEYGYFRNWAFLFAIHTQLTCVNCKKMINFESSHIPQRLGLFLRVRGVSRGSREGPEGAPKGLEGSQVRPPGPTWDPLVDRPIAKRAQSLGNMATFEIEHFCFNSHTWVVCEFEKMLNFETINIT